MVCHLLPFTKVGQYIYIYIYDVDIYMVYKIIFLMLILYYIMAIMLLTSGSLA